MKLPLLLALSLGSGACATSFTGSAHVKGGKVECEATCREQGLELGGMVFLGQYTSGCVCVVPGQSSAAHLTGVAGALAGGGVGVAEQMRRSEESSSLH